MPWGPVPPCAIRASRKKILPASATPPSSNAALIRATSARRCVICWRPRRSPARCWRWMAVRINVDLATDDFADAQDMLENVVDYHVIEKRIRAIIAEGHVRLAETLAERIAAACFEDARVRTVRVRVEKLQALTYAESVGIEIERTR